MKPRYHFTAFAVLLGLSLHAQGSCGTAITITPGIHAVASPSGDVPDAPRCANNDQGPATHAAWYRFTATTNNHVHITTDVVDQPQVDTRFHVYSGGCDALQCVVGNDNGGWNGTSRASFLGIPGETYYIVFDDRWSTSGFSFQLSEQFYPLSNGENYTSFTSSFLGFQGNPLGIVDMNGDGLDDAIAVTQTQIHIHYQQQDGGFNSVLYQTDYADYPASWSLCAGDLDGNGYKDLLYGGGYGVTFMFATDDGAGFIERSGPEYVFSQRSNMVDINNDGHMDAFVCHDVAPNVFYLNDGAGQFQFYQGGLGQTCGNYGSIWVDYDNDGDMDVYVAKCGCDPSDLLMRNDGNGVFVQVPGPLGNFDYHQSWSSAWGDFDNDGDMDALIGSSAGTVHYLMENDGAGNFSNVTGGSGIDAFGMQSIEWVTHDFNNDGLLDIMGGGAFMINLGGMRFAQNSQITGVGGIGDVNNDGALDVVGQGGLQLGVPNGNHWLRVALHGAISNTDGIGARITVQTASGQQIREVRSGDGFRYMSSITPHFGLGSDDVVESITVRWPSGIVQVVYDVDVDQVVNITEQVSTAIPEPVQEAPLVAFPNPASDRIWFNREIDPGQQIAIVDVAGRIVGTRSLRDGTLYVTDLAPGLYTARVQVNGVPREVRFRKD